MASIMLEDNISEEDLARHRDKYRSIPNPTENDKFQFALNLVRASSKADIREGLSLFLNLFTKTRDEDMKRDALYYMAIAETKLNNYEQALKYLQTILNIQPSNEQVRDLYIEVSKKMKRDGLIGLGIVGSAALVGVVGLLGLGAAVLAKK